mgnify:CR=1 FL=1
MAKNSVLEQALLEAKQLEEAVKSNVQMMVLLSHKMTTLLILKTKKRVPNTELK